MTTPTPITSSRPWIPSPTWIRPPPGLSTRRQEKVRFASTTSCSSPCCRTDNHTRRIPISEITIKKVKQGDVKRDIRAVEINSIEKERTVEITIDSGAAETVTGKYIFPEFETTNDHMDNRPDYILPSRAELKHHG